MSDLDGDGLPAYLDISDVPYIQPLHVNASVVRLMETDPGLKLVLGKYARQQYSDGVQLSEQELMATAGIPSDDLESLNDYFDFEVHNVRPYGASASIVVPLAQAIPEFAVYRKYTEANGWQDFMLNANNALATTQPVNGVCPPPHSSAYVNGLNQGDTCLRLTIEDGGSNDADGIANGVIDDPSGMAVQATTTIDKQFDAEKSSSGSFNWLLILGLSLVSFMRRKAFKR